MPLLARIDLAFDGADADDRLIDFYDVAEALLGFQRSLAITTHFALNGEVITQAPSLKGARLLAIPPEEGSWKFTVLLATIGTGILQLNAVPKDTPVGNMVQSTYDYVLKQSLGFHVDYDKTLLTQYEEYKKLNPESRTEMTESRLDSVIEKCESAFKQMHRPMTKSRTADEASVHFRTNDEPWDIPALNRETFNFLNYSELSDAAQQIRGRVSSYNLNTYKGRIFCFSEGRPIPFVLDSSSQDTLSVRLVTSSLAANAVSRAKGRGDLTCTAMIERSRTGIAKRYIILSVDDLLQ